MCERGGVRPELGEEVRRGPYVSLHRGDCEHCQHGAGLAGQAGVQRYQPDDLAQVKAFLRTVSVAVRVPGREIFLRSCTYR